VVICKNATVPLRCNSETSSVGVVRLCSTPKDGGSNMLAKKSLVAAIAVGALALTAAAPASAVVPFFPWILGRHLVGAVVGLATLPLAVASSMAPAAPYPPAPGYGGAPGYAVQSGYYSGPPAYYPRPPAYYAGPQGYYRPPVAYPRSAPRYYGPPRGYSAPHAGYTGGYGAHVPYQPGRFAYRRR
jgi:hypothetical protein